MGMTGIVIVGIIFLLCVLIYAIFFSSKKALRIIIIISVLGLALVLILGILNIGKVIERSKAHRETIQKEALKEALEKEKQLVADFNPEIMDHGTIKPFKAVHTIKESRLIADYTMLGPDLKNAIDINKIEKIVYDHKNDTYYALDEWGDLVKFNLANRDFEKIKIDPTLKDYCWPKGIAFDSDKKDIIIMTSHVFSNLFSYNINTHQWKKMTSGMRDVGLVALTYSASDQVFYALEKGSGTKSFSSIRVFNRNGAPIGNIKISPQIPINNIADERVPSVQMKFSSGKIILIISSSYLKREVLDKAYIFAIDPQSGKVSIAKKEI